MKGWRSTLEEHVATWTQRHPVTWVPKFVYHFTDVCNAAKVLSMGRLLSRNEAVSQGVMVTDNASQTIIGLTAPEHLGYVRLYFRPKTPTQYRNEGIRRPAERFQNAHCPVPVFFLFDLVGVIETDGVRCSDGNMASGYVQHSETEEFFRSIPFEKVYHSGPLADSEKQTVVFHRHAEVLVPDELLLAPHLKAIACRSMAEKQTLLSLLSPERRKKWEQRISIASVGLFHCDHAHVESVAAVDDTIQFKLRLRPGPKYAMRVQVVDDDGKKRKWSGSVGDATLLLRLPAPLPNSATVTLYIEDCLAFQGDVEFDSIPF